MRPAPEYGANCLQRTDKTPAVLSVSKDCLAFACTGRVNEGQSFDTLRTAERCQGLQPNPEPHPRLPSRIQRLSQIGDDVIDMLQPDRKPYIAG